MGLSLLECVCLSKKNQGTKVKKQPLTYTILTTNSVSLKPQIIPVMDKTWVEKNKGAAPRCAKKAYEVPHSQSNNPHFQEHFLPREKKTCEQRIKKLGRELEDRLWP